MKNKFGFRSAEHALNYQAKVQRRKSGKQPVKVYTGEELAKMAEIMGYTVSPNHKPPQPKPVKTSKKTNEVEIIVDDLPEHLKRLV